MVEHPRHYGYAKQSFVFTDVQTGTSSDSVTRSKFLMQAGCDDKF
jgi:hypothetical protein